MIRQNTPRPLGQMITKIMTRTFRRHGLRDAQIVKIAAHWPEIAGGLAEASAPRYIGHRALTVHACGGEAIELQHQAPQIIQRANNLLGDGNIQRLKIVQRPPHQHS